MFEIETIFFDVDGTLADSRSDIANAMNFTLRELGLKEKDSKVIVSYIGTGVKDLIRKSVGKENEALVGRGVEIFSDYYVRHAADKTELYPHVREILDYFRNKRKFILTNRYKKFAQITLTQLGIRDYFEDIIGGDDEECLKPSACVLDRVILPLGIEKSKAIIVGDMAIDIMTGKNAGIKTCWVSYGLGKLADVKSLKPDFIIDDIIEMEGLLK